MFTIETLEGKNVGSFNLNSIDERRLNKFNVSVIDGNVGSATMMKKLGCREEGVKREVIYTEGNIMMKYYLA